MINRNYQRSNLNLNPIWVLIGINVILFIASLKYPTLIVRFGLIPGYITARPWTMITSMFLHGGFGHILANMITLYFFGRYLRLLIGDWKLLGVYFVGGILGNLLYILLASPFSVAIGASGAVFAMGGVLSIMRPRIRVFIFPIPIPIPIWVAVIIGFFITALFSNVAWQAHLGGLAFGLAIGYYFRRRERHFF